MPRRPDSARITRTKSPIAKSESYALVDYFGKVVAKGSKASIKKLSKKQGGTIYMTSLSVGEKAF